MPTIKFRSPSSVAPQLRVHVESLRQTGEFHNWADGVKQSLAPVFARRERCYDCGKKQEPGWKYCRLCLIDKGLITKEQ